MNFNATIIGQSIAFAFFVWFCMKYVWPPIVGILEERQKKIADGLEAAERAQKDLALAQQNVVKQLETTKHEAAAIIDQANKRASQIEDEARTKAKVEGARLVAQAKSEIDQEVVRAKEALRAQISVIAIAGAEKILESSVNKAANEEMLKKLASEL